MISHTHLPTHLEHGTGGAVRADAFTDVLAEGDEQRVDLDPIMAWKFFLEFEHGLLRGASLHIAPAIDHAMDMNIDADAALSASDSEREVRAFGADSFERKKGICVAWKRAAVLLHRFHRDLANGCGLSFVKAAGPDQFVDSFDREFGESFRLMRLLEKPPGRRDGDFVQGPNGNNAGDELFENRFVAGVGQLEHRRLTVRADGVSNVIKRDVDIERQLGVELEQRP